ncbi:mitochondrial carrier [Aulographum hederae CBS 113979]|uniref:Mitochondrial carrier n=1 Tax=Aulographum hederae CBS 113979 TaxID=1176131 RepID=A0A6G1HGK0_9PEZI|nr:mitochondrial carrier [Aulographum hederae CBS 113979]
MELTKAPLNVEGDAESPSHAAALGALSDQGKEALKDIAFGSAAGIAGKFIEYPFDTVKVRLQSQPDHLPLRYSGPLDCFKQSLRKDGFSGLYRGITAPLIGAAVETSSLFFSYRLAQDLLQSTILPPTKPLPMSALLVCGGASGAFTSLLLTPIELIKCKMQVPIETSSPIHRRPGILSHITSVYRHHGLAGFWHGQLGTLIRETGGSAAWFGSYEGMSVLFRQLRDQRSSIPPTSASASAGPTTSASPTTSKDAPLPIYQQMASGAIAGMSYNFLFYPADTIKSRMQTEEVGKGNARARATFWGVGKAVWRQHGIRGMYRGCGITVFRAAPSSAFIFTIYEALRNAFA